MTLLAHDRRVIAADVGTAAQLACLLEVSAPKPGNVSPGSHFGDTRFEDFLASEQPGWREREHGQRVSVILVSMGGLSGERPRLMADALARR